MKKHAAILAMFLTAVFTGLAQNADTPVIEVTGSSTLNIIPNRITIEIGMGEYYKKGANGDSILIKLSDIEKTVRNTLGEAGISDSLIVVSDLGNYLNRDISSTFLMSKRLSAVVTDFNQIDQITSHLDRNGIESFSITKIENSNIEQYNRQGLKMALDAARLKAEYIAENECLKLLTPYEIVETTNEASMYSAFSNVTYDSGSGMDNLRRIVRRYSVKVRYLFK
ncbi:MAG: SIMPL domain-containing protein [Muribaculaceae bacterium]|nr:SIMPL domain-containing protein [Muribaculaceae bacterium]